MEILNPGSLVRVETIDSAEQIGSQRKLCARTTDGTYSFNVTEPDFTDGKMPVVDLEVMLYADGVGSIQVFYDNGGPSLVSGGNFSYNQTNSTVTVVKSFSLSGAHFGSTEDIRIVVTGDSPGLISTKVVSNKLPGGNIVLDNNDSSNTTTKTWTVSNLNNTNPTVTGTSGTANGTVSAAGQLDPGDSFSLSASAVINWNSTNAQTAISNGTFGAYLASLPAGRIQGSSGNIGPDSRTVFSGDDPQSFGQNSQEAMVYTVNTSNLQDVSLYFLAASWALGSAGDRLDFLIFDVSENKVIKQRWNADLNISGSWALDHGDKIIFGTGASNGANEYRLSTLTLDVVEINYPPAFTADPIVEANATGGVAYSGSIADNASDPESNPMIFSKLSGPVWLNVAANGTLSGTPGSGNAGPNNFTVQVAATGGSDTATLEINVIAGSVNQPPVFTSNTIVEANGSAGVAYSGTIADNASDPESDPMTFSLLPGGPTWLAVAPNGTLSGTPTSGDLGLNSFTVQVDATGGSDTATLEITVAAAPVTNGTLTLDWKGLGNKSNLGTNSSTVALSAITSSNATKRHRWFCERKRDNKRNRCQFRGERKPQCGFLRR
ncbi:MAG: hypothetical protein HC901_01990 [Bdellovibrionaceae bacterium]|nr:hypothetical protein [Pseudobdellovibrionaceae bacterium]